MAVRVARRMLSRLRCGGVRRVEVSLQWRRPYTSSTLPGAIGAYRAVNLLPLAAAAKYPEILRKFIL